MADKRIKGLTVEIGGDTTNLGKALESAEKKANDLTSELGEINRQLKFDPSNTELLGQKQKVLAGIIEQTSQKLDKLKEAEKQVQEQFERGEVSEEQVRALQREIIATESKLGSYTNAAKKTADEVANLGKEFKNTEANVKNLENELKDINSSLKLDPSSTELLGQKQEVLAGLVDQTSKKLDALRASEKQVQEQFARGEASAEQVRELQREIIETSNSLGRFKNELEDAKNSADIYGKSTEDASASLKKLADVNKKLDLDPKNVSLVAEKQKLLAKAADDTRKSLESLKKEEKKLQEQFKKGEASEAQIRDIQDAIADAERRMKSFKSEVEATANELGDLVKEGQEASDTMANALGTGLKAAGAGFTAVIAGATAATESSREYRTDMGKLEVAFETAGHTQEAAVKTYKELQSILGDSAQAVEAANHLAQLADTEEELAKWTEISTGVYASFGASLPIEGLTEAANETAKVGAVTGPLADAINWARASSDQWKTALGGNAEALKAFETATAEGMGAEDAFNEALAACTTEQERQALITSTLTGLYGEASEKYKETNADVIAANEANEKMAASTAAIGEKVEPVLTQVKLLGAELLGKLVPVIDAITNNLPAVGAVLAGVTAAMIAFKVASIAATAATQGMTLAQYAAAAAQGVLNTVMNANPIGLIILAVTALVAAFMVLWNNCEGFREFWIGLWDGIQKVVGTVVEWVKQNWQAMLLFLVNPLAGIFKYCYDNFEGFRETVDGVFQKIKTTFVGFIDNLKALPSNIWNAIVGAVQRIEQWGSDLVAKAKTSASNLISDVTSTLQALPGNIWNAIVGSVQRVGQWGSDMATKAKTSMATLISSVVSKLKELPGKVVSIGKDLVSGLWQGVSDRFSWLKEKISGFATSVLDGIKDFFGVHSPSTKTAWIGEMLDEGMAKGVEDNADTPLKAMDRLSSEMLDEAAGDTLNVERRVSHSFAGAASPAVDSGLLAKLDRILAAIESGKSIYLDSDILVGATVGQYDVALGRRQALVERGAI